MSAVVLYNATSDKLHEESLRWNTMIKRLALFDIVSSFVAATLCTIDLNYFELYIHNIEYCTTIFMIVIDYVMWKNLALSKGARNKFQLPVLLGIGFSMLIIYNCMPGPYNEYVSHILEFPTDLVGGLVIFYTSAESKRKADLAIFNTMYRPCTDGETPAIEVAGGGL